MLRRKLRSRDEKFRNVFFGYVICLNEYLWLSCYSTIYYHVNMDTLYMKSYFQHIT